MRDDPFLVSSSPSSSPPSSPSFGPADSSPPSSPGRGPLSTPSASPSVLHPFAGSTKATRRPRLYEKRDQSLGWATEFSPKRRFEEHEDSPEDDRRVRIRRRSVESIDAGDHLHAIHPYSAAAKPAWKPPQEERKLDRVVSETLWPPAPRSFSRAASESPAGRVMMTRAVSSSSLGDFSLSDDDDAVEYPLGANIGEVREKETWEQAIAGAVDTGDGSISLGQSGLFKNPLYIIPPSIGDLSNLVVLPKPKPTTAPERSTRKFSRSFTVPASPSTFWAGRSARGPTALGKGASFNVQRTDAGSESHVGEVQIHLENNAIVALPSQIFSLMSLTVLNMCGNRLVRIPPQIVRLKNLRDLNVARNSLPWLPSEMLEMRLDHLALYGNPWIEPPEGDAFRKIRPVSTTTVHFSMPSLSECCLRQLLRPAAATMDTMKPLWELETELEVRETCPLSEGLPPALLETFRACLPRAVAAADATASPTKQADSAHAVRSREDAPLLAVETHPGIGICPSPQHCSVFVQWAEERFTWESVVAGKNISIITGPGIPVRWRGCASGCLDHLESEADEGTLDAGEDTDVEGDAEMGDASDGEEAPRLDVSGGFADIVDADEFE